MTDVLEQRRGGDVYTRLEAVERVVQYVRDLAAGK
jgi:hypothetical protein